MLLLALFVAIQDPAARVVDEVDRKLMNGASPEAAAAAFDEDYRLVVDPARWDVAFVTSVDRPAELAVTALPLFKKRGEARVCVVAIDLAVRSASSEVAINWSRVNLLLDGVSRGAVPGFARTMTASLDQRPSTAPPGAAIAEKIFPVDAKEGDCISEGAAEIGLDVPLTVAGVAERARVVVRKEAAPRTEAEIFANVPAPFVRDVNAGIDPDPFPMATAVGAGAGATVGLGIGTAVAIGSPGDLATRVGGAAAATLIFGALCGGAAGGLGWWLVDSPADTLAKEQRQRLEVQAKEQRQRDAWLKRRRDLGLPSPAAP